MATKTVEKDIITVPYSQLVPRESFVSAYQEVDRIIDEILDRTPKALRATERLNSGLIGAIERRGNKNCYGYTTPDAYTAPDGKQLHQVTLFLETFKFGIDQIAETMVHEMAHATNHLLGVNDCTANVHSKKFKETAEMFGLIVEKGKPSIGWGITSVSPELKEWIDTIIRPNPEPFRILINEKEPKEKTPSKSTLYECDCTKVRCNTELQATCVGCGQPFLKV